MVVILALMPVLSAGCSSSSASGNRGVAPPSYFVGNIKKGDFSENPCYVFNDNNYEATFEVAYKYPDNIDREDGYGYPPLPAKDWVTFNGEYLRTYITIPAQTEAEVAVRLEIPANTRVEVKKWVFWVTVIETGQGFVQYGAYQKWHISMKE